jgi:hypothetical protein
LLDTIAQSHAIGEAGQSIKSRQMVDLGFGNLARGDILNKNDHPAVFHRPNCKFKRPAIQHLDNKGGVIVTCKPGIKAVDKDSRVGLGNETRVDTAFHYMIQTRTFQLATGR